MPRQPRRQAKRKKPAADDVQRQLCTMFNIQTCTELEAYLHDHPEIPKEKQVEMIQTHRDDIKRVCTQYLAMKRLGGKHLKAYVDLVQDTLKNLRVVVLEQLENAKNSLVMSPDAAAAGPNDDDGLPQTMEGCIDTLRMDCAALDRRLAELTAGVVSAPGLLARGREKLGQLVKLVTDGGGYTLWFAGTKLLKLTLHTFDAVLPYIINFVSSLVLFTLTSPKVALAVFIFVKHVKRRICERVAHWWVRNGLPAPEPGTTIVDMGAAVNLALRASQDFARIVGNSSFSLYVAQGVASFFSQKAGWVGGILTAACHLSAFTAPAAAFVGIIAQESTEILTEMVRQKCEYGLIVQGVNNAFGQLFAVINPTDCWHVYHRTVGLGDARRDWGDLEFRIDRGLRDEATDAEVEDALRACLEYTELLRATVLHYERMVRDDPSHPIGLGSRDADAWLQRAGRIEQIDNMRVANRARDLKDYRMARAKLQEQLRNQNTLARGGRRSVVLPGSKAYVTAMQRKPTYNDQPEWNQ